MNKEPTAVYYTKDTVDELAQLCLKLYNEVDRVSESGTIPDKELMKKAYDTLGTVGVFPSPPWVVSG